jgi:chorismate synthase
MSGSIFGKNFSISTFGESHGVALGVTIDGCPAGIDVSIEDIMKDMNRRKPGNAKISTARKEEDAVEILSGVFEGKTTGTPIGLLIRNKDQHSAHYDTIKNVFRPSHADYTYEMKYGIRDYRGGGRSSARETAARVAAGAVAKKFLSALGIQIKAYTRSLGPIVVQADDFNEAAIDTNPLSMPNEALAQKAIALIGDLKKEKDSIGGVVECRVTGLPVGVGEPIFDRLDALLGQAIMSINATKAFEIGCGVACSTLKGSEYNDLFYLDESGNVAKRTNFSGGVLGGLSDGSELLLRAHFKPTPSIAKEQPMLTKELEEVNLAIHGRHDPTVVPRAVVVVEAMTALTLADLILQGSTSTLDRIKRAYDL